MSRTNIMHGLLKVYSNANYVTQQRAKFILYLCFVLFVTVLSLIFLRLYFHPLSNIHNTSHLTVLLPLVLVFFVNILCLVLLVKGYYKISANLLPIIVLAIVWLIIFIGENTLLARLNTVVYIFAVLSMLPLLIQEKSYVILLIATFNIIVLLTFILLFKDKLGLSRVDFWDYIIDASVSFALVGFVSYFINKIYLNDLKKAQDDLNEKIKTEKLLIESELKYREITELLPQIVFEIDMNGNVNYINQTGLKKFGYMSDEIDSSFSVTDFIVEKEVLLSSINKIANGEELPSLRYNAIAKNKKTFPIQVYSDLIIKEGNPVGLRGIAVDLTDEVKAEKAIRESQERFSSAFKSNPAPMAISDIETGLFIDVNDNWVQFIGYSRDEHIGRTSIDLNYWFDNDDRIRIIKIIKENGFFKDEFVTVRTKSGQKIIAKWSAEVITLNDKKVMLSLCSNETEKLKAEAALRESEERFSVSFKSSPAPLIISEIETGEIIDANDKWVEMLGYTYSEQIGKTTKDLGIFANSKDRDNLIKKLEIDGFLKDEKVKFITKSGYRIIAKWSAETITLNGRKVLLSLITDETEKIKAEEEVLQSRELFKTLIDSSPISITLSDLQGKILVANNVFSKYAAQPVEHIIGKTAKEIGITTDYDDEKEALQQFKNTGIIKNFETNVLNHKGEKFFMLFSAQIVTFNGQSGFLQTSIDITDRKHLEEELKKYNEQLEFLVKERTEELEASNEELRATNEELYTQREHLSLTLEKLKETQEQLIQTEKMASLGVLTAGVAHEINNPINYIYNGAMAIENFLVDNSPENIETLKPLFEAINTGIQRVTGIVKSLNKYSRKDESSFVECNVNEIVENALTMLYNQSKKRISIVREYSEKPPILFAKEGELHQVFLNILINAIQSIEGKGKITVRTAIHKMCVEVIIIDSGVGIHPENIKKIFDPFYTTKDPGKGTGLGLSITRRIIQEHKGSINCYSKLGKGTKFVITLPQKQEE
ncbi:MAG TPA: PAS domain S-box protein [Tenuifilaceae bacterium]|nr:PAS domain S-box protein [Tenuifilaceae bacterium]